MRTIFSYLRDGIPYAGIMGAESSDYIVHMRDIGKLESESGRRDATVKSYDYYCKNMDCKFQTNSGGVVHVCCDNSLPESTRCQIFKLDSLILSTKDLLHELLYKCLSYDVALSSLKNVVHAEAKKIDYGRHGDSLVIVKKVSLERMIAAVDEMSDLMDETNDLVNSLDTGSFEIPAFLEQFLYEAKTIGLLKSREGRFSIEELRLFQEVKSKKTLSSVGVPFEYAYELESLRNEILRNARAKELFDQWIHDANHYMCRLRFFLTKRLDNKLSLDSYHSIDALCSALITLRDEFASILGINTGQLCPMQKRDTYQPYRLFHRYRYCYLDEGISWTSESDPFIRVAKYVEGIESVALNLYSNAVKYLSRYSGDKVIQTDFIQHETHVEIRITSMGPEVSSDEMDRILEGGYRAKTVRNIYPGLGMGLCRVRKICEDAGYKFTVSNGRKSCDCRGYCQFVAKIEIPNECFVD